MSFARLRPAAVRPLAFAVLSALSVLANAAETPLVADTYVTTAAPGANYGATASLNVGAGASTLLRFDLTSLPAGTAPSNLRNATLVLYVNRVGVAGAVEVQALDSAWSEASVSAATVPGNERNTSTASSVVGAAGQFITLDVTDKVMAWIAAGNGGNFGFLIQPAAGSPNTNVFFDSKENTLTGHAARLDLTLAGQGAAGPDGLPGATGPAGPSTAITGPAGPVGPQGAKGDAGMTGAAGATGSAGAVGPAGAVGAAGAAGQAGTSGATGVTGATGAAGLAGAQGPKGDPGASGPSGLKGDVGLTGPAGPAGVAGAIGVVGAVGRAGATGAAGAGGAAGSAGAPGAAGLAGAAGARGGAGPAGAAGAVGVSGLVGATGAAGAFGPNGPAGDRGATGLTGPQGTTGPGGLRGPAGPAALQGLLGIASNYGATAGNGAECTLGEITLFAGTVGNGVPADGRLLPVNEADALFNLYGTTFGGDGVQSFALPNLRSVTPNGMQYYVCDIGVYPRN
jgi:hypothetical protein